MEPVSTPIKTAEMTSGDTQHGATCGDYPVAGPGGPVRQIQGVARGAPGGPFRFAPDSGQIEHRQGVRHRVLALVKVHDSDHQCKAGLLYDCSADGMFVLSEVPPGVNRRVDIEFALSPAWGMAITIKGIVVHCRKTGFGLMFYEPDDPALALLGEWLR